MPSPPLTVMARLRVPQVLAWVRQVRPLSILEIGPGQGGLAARLAAIAPCYVGLEPDEQSAAVASARLAQYSGAEIRTIGAVGLGADERFELVVACEVLEHLEDDVGALVVWRQHLRHRGMLLLSVPAHHRRFAAADVAVGHVRRYDLADLARALDLAGFELLVWQSYGALGGHAWEALRNWVFAARGLGHSDRAAATAASGRLFQPQAWWHGAITWIIACPLRVLQWPFSKTAWGIGWLVLARARG